MEKEIECKFDYDEKITVTYQHDPTKDHYLFMDCKLKEELGEIQAGTEVPIIKINLNTRTIECLFN